MYAPEELQSGIGCSSLGTKHCHQRPSGELASACTNWQLGPRLSVLFHYGHGKQLDIKEVNDAGVISPFI